MEITVEELDLIRQWCNAVSDVTPEYLEDKDRVLFRKILSALGRDKS